jgi:hypothetical protein
MSSELVDTYGQCLLLFVSKLSLVGICGSEKACDNGVLTAKVAVSSGICVTLVVYTLL